MSLLKQPLEQRLVAEPDDRFLLLHGAGKGERDSGVTAAKISRSNPAQATRWRSPHSR